jgi:hypothetical protein
VAAPMTDDWGGGYEPTPLMQLADQAGLTYWQLWGYLEREVERRRTTPNPRLNVPEPAHGTMRDSTSESLEKPHG